MANADLFDHERLDVYRATRELIAVVDEVLRRQKLSRDLHDQIDRASQSVMFNIGEGAGKTARSDKRRAYEIARGSAMELATQFDLLRIRSLIAPQQYSEARTLLLRIVKMLSRLCSNPRSA